MIEPFFNQVGDLFKKKKKSSGTDMSRYYNKDQVDNKLSLYDKSSTVDKKLKSDRVANVQRLNARTNSIESDAKKRFAPTYHDGSHASTYFKKEDTLEAINDRVNALYGSSVINKHELSAGTSATHARRYANASYNSMNSITAEKVGHEPVSRKAKNQILRYHHDAQLASGEVKKLLEKIHDDYSKIVFLGTKSHQLAQIIANLAVSSKVLNSTTMAAANLSNKPFDINAIESGEYGNVSKVIADAIKDPLNNIGHFSYAGYPSSQYTEDIVKIDELRSDVYNNGVDLCNNYIKYVNDLENSNKYKYKIHRHSNVDSNIRDLMPDRLESALIKHEKKESFDNMNIIENFNNVVEMCGRDGKYDDAFTIPSSWEQTLNAGQRIKMCNAYHNNADSNENITELEELLAQKKNLASDVMLNYILNEDNNNQSTIKQVYDKINDENNLKLRKIKDKEYSNKKNIDNLKILKFAILLFFISVPFLMLQKKEIISINLLFFVIFVLMIVFVIFSGTIIYKQMAADKFNYNKIDKTINNQNTSKHNNNKDSENINMYSNNNNKLFSSIFGCFNSDCCSDGTTYDSTKKRCV